jgi:hypothetical protein
MTFVTLFFLSTNTNSSVVLRSKNKILQESSITNVINIEQDDESSLDEFLVPPQNFSDDEFYSDKDAIISDETKAVMNNDDDYMDLLKSSIYFLFIIVYFK